jgi:hypothetical protein
MKEAYTKMISANMENTLADLRLLNNILSVNTEIYKTSLRQIKDNVNMFSKIVVDNAKTFDKAMKLYNAQEPKDYTGKEIHKSQ